MLASQGMHTFVLLAAVALSACGDKSYEPPDVDSTAYTPPDARVSPAARTAIAHLIGDLRVATGAAADPELAGVPSTIDAAVVGEGRITGVTAGSALRTRQLRSLLQQVLESSPVRSAPRRMGSGAISHPASWLAGPGRG